MPNIDSKIHGIKNDDTRIEEVMLSAKERVDEDLLDDDDENEGRRKESFLPFS